MKGRIRFSFWLVFLLLQSIFGGLSNTTAVHGASEVATAWKVSVDAGRIQESSPTLADLDGDGNLEIIIATSGNGRGPALIVMDAEGRLRWKRNLSDPVASAPAVVDLDYPPDGTPEIVVTTGGDAHQQRGSVVAFDRSGAQLWRYDTVDAQGTGTPSGNFASPVVGDVDGDGEIEIIVASWDRNIYLLDHRGRYVWHYHVADTVWSTPILADLNRDGNLEIIVGTDMTGGGVLPDGYAPTDGGFLLVLDEHGQKLARKQINEAVFSSPAVGDVNQDGNLEIFVGSGMYWYIAGNYSQPYVYGFSVDASGAEWEINDLPGWPRKVAYPGMSSPALADLDGDGDLEVIIGSGYTGASDPDTCSGSQSDPDCKGALYAWHHSGEAVDGFPVWPVDYKGKNAFIQSSPVVGDVDADGNLDIVFTMLWDVIVVGHDGRQQRNLQTSYSLFSSPALGDLDGNGQTNVIVGGSDYYTSDQGRIYNFEYQPGSYSADAMPWPMFHRDAQNSGLVPAPPQIRAEFSSLMIFVDTNTPLSLVEKHLEILNVGEGEIEWQALSPERSISVSPDSGTLLDRTQIALTVDSRDFRDGIYHSSISIHGYVDQQEVLGSPLTIPVVVYKGPLHRVYVPLTTTQ